MNLKAAHTTTASFTVKLVTFT